MNVNIDKAFCAGNQFTMAEAETSKKICKGKKPSAEVQITTVDAAKRH